MNEPRACPKSSLDSSSSVSVGQLTTTHGPFERGLRGGENPFTIQAALQDMMQSHVGIVRMEGEMQQALDEIAALRARVGGLVDHPAAGALLRDTVFRPAASRRWDDLIHTATGSPLGATAFAAELGRP